MQISTDPNVWVVYGLIFLLGILVGLFMTVGGRKKWKTRYYDEVERRKELETTYAETEREWRERDSLRAAAIKDRDSKIDRDGDGIADKHDPIVDTDKNGIDDRDEAVAKGYVKADPAKIDKDGDGIVDRKK